jgi:hypothetical protein
MSRFTFIHYRQRRGREEELIKLLREQFPKLRATGLITERKVAAMKTRAGGILALRMRVIKRLNIRMYRKCGWMLTG